MLLGTSLWTACEAVQLFTADISLQVVWKCQIFGSTEKACGWTMSHTKGWQLACLNNGPPLDLLGFVHSATFQCSHVGRCRFSVQAKAQKVLTQSDNRNTLLSATTSPHFGIIPEQNSSPHLIPFISFHFTQHLGIAKQTYPTTALCLCCKIT